MSEENVKEETFRKMVPDISFTYLVTAPFIYILIVPVVFLHFLVEVYQRICFPVYGIELVKFKDFFNLDRVKLCHLTTFEKLNCLYCDYANGCLAYVSEIAGRTEKYWCPIKHENKRKKTHDHYKDFFEYSDKDGFRENKKNLMRK